MKQKPKILFFCMIFVANAAFSQNSPKINGYSWIDKGSFLPTGTALIYPKCYLNNKVLPANFYSSQLGFFCKKEWKLESATKVPFRFRLGSVQYCDWLEGKKGAGVVTH
jgi:hypothetical protein